MSAQECAVGSESSSQASASDVWGDPAAAAGTSRVEPVELLRAKLRTFHIRDVSPRHRFEAFVRRRNALGDPSQCSLHRTPAEQFHAEATILQGAAVSLLQYSVSPFRNMFTQACTSRIAEPRLWLLGQISGGGVLAARGGTRSFGPLSLFLLITSEPFTLTFDRPGSAVAVNIPIETISLQRNEIHRLAFSVLPARRLLHTLLLPTTRALLDRCGPELERQGVDHCLTGLADLVIRTADGLEPDHTNTHEARRLQIEHYVRNHLAEPGLCAHSIATELQISVRLVHKLFQGQPETLHDLIQRQRVEHAERLLAAHPELRMERIAAKSGFGSTKTLVRAFHRVYGESPSQHSRTG